MVLTDIQLGLIKARIKGSLVPRDKSTTAELWGDFRHIPKDAFGAASGSNDGVVTSQEIYIVSWGFTDIAAYHPDMATWIVRNDQPVRIQEISKSLYDQIASYLENNNEKVIRLDHRKFNRAQFVGLIALAAEALTGEKT